MISNIAAIPARSDHGSTQVATNDEELKSARHSPAHHMAQAVRPS